MRRWTLRTRVALAASAAMLLGVVGFGVGVQLYLGDVLHRQLDHTLQVRAADVDPVAELPQASAILQSDPRHGGTDVEIVGNTGHVELAASPPLPASGLAVAARVAADHRSRYTTFSARGETYRVFLQKLKPGGVVAVMASTDSTEDALAQARELTVIAAVIAALIAGGAGILLTDRALRPLRTLNAEVGQIQATADPSRRITAAATGDEIEQLATALNAMLEALQRAREVERSFLADASHEMRTPLTALRGNAAYLARHGGDTEAFHDLESDMERLARLLDQLLAVAREDAAAPPTRPIDAAELVDALGSSADVHVSAAPGLMVQADPDSIERALINLIDNARRYGPAGGPIDVHAERDGDEVVLSVTDSGTGLDGVSTEQAAMRFWRGPNSIGTDGAGLGLGLVQAAADRHGGTFAVHGSRFELRLPALDPAGVPR